MTGSVQFVLPSKRAPLVVMAQSSSNRPIPPVHEIRPAVRRNTPESVRQRVARNLFGAPKKGESGELLARETAQRRFNILQRFDIDILNPASNSRSEAESTKDNENNVSQSERFPILIAKELSDHEKRLSGEVVVDTCKSAKCQEQVHTKNGCSAISDSTIIGISPDESLSSSKSGTADSSERLKPYSRQRKMTECYPLRKTNIGKNNRTAIAIVAASHQQKLDVVPLPKSIRAAQYESLTSSSATSSSSVLNNEEPTSQPLEELPPYK